MDDGCKRADELRPGDRVVRLGVIWRVQGVERNAGRYLTDYRVTLVDDGEPWVLGVMGYTLFRVLPPCTEMVRAVQAWAEEVAEL